MSQSACKKLDTYCKKRIFRWPIGHEEVYPRRFKPFVLYYIGLQIPLGVWIMCPLRTAKCRWEIKDVTYLYSVQPLLKTPVTPGTNKICYYKLLLEFKNTGSGVQSSVKWCRVSLADLYWRLQLALTINDFRSALSEGFFTRLK